MSESQNVHLAPKRNQTRVPLPIGYRQAIVTADDVMLGFSRFVASNVTAGIVPGSGHWIMEENPQATVELVTEFLRK